MTHYHSASYQWTLSFRQVAVVALAAQGGLDAMFCGHLNTSNLVRKGLLDHNGKLTKVGQAYITLLEHEGVSMTTPQLVAAQSKNL